MRTIYYACLFATFAASPALALSPDEQAKVDSYVRIMGDYHDKQRAARKARVQAQADLCKKLGGASIGMNAAAVIKSCWGKPHRINETLTARGKHEQWVYGGGYLYLENGVVTSIQTSR